MVTPNNGMHPTADTTALIHSKGSGLRVVAGVRCSQVAKMPYGAIH